MNQHEPVAIGGAISTLAAAIIAVLVGFGIVVWTAEQVGLALALVSALILVTTVIVRGKVSPVAGLQNPGTKE